MAKLSALNDRVTALLTDLLYMVNPLTGLFYKATVQQLKDTISTTKLLGQSGIPLIIPSSGTMGNNGALSGIAALPIAYPAAYVYLPAGAISSGSAAGLYYAVFSSTTTATVYNNTYVSGDPVIPGSPTPFATVGPGAYAQVTTEITLPTITVPANLLGANGQIEGSMLWVYVNSANLKNLRVRFGGTSMSSVSASASLSSQTYVRIANCGAVNAQVSYPSLTSGVGASSQAPSNSSIDTTADTTITVTAQLTAAAETIILRSYQFRAQPKS